MAENNRHTTEIKDEDPTLLPVRRAYISPSLVCFGRVVGLTMGSDGMGNDGSIGMTGFTGTPGGMGDMMM